jgi:hypothetical protein
VIRWLDLLIAWLWDRCKNPKDLHPYLMNDQINALRISTKGEREKGAGKSPSLRINCFVI